MDVLTPVITGALLALFTGLQAWINKGRFDQLDNELSRLRSDVAADIAALRSDLLQVALAATGRSKID